MPTTRSQTKQTHIEDFTKDEKEHPIKKAAPKKPKRPADPPNPSPPSKHQKTVSKSPETKKSMSKQTAALMQHKPKDADPETTAGKGDSNAIMINRAPVLDLWATMVTRFLYPSLSWETCLSAGSAVAALCAVSKGRSIGVIEPSDKKDKTTKKEDADELEELEVMGFKLKLEKDLVVVGGKTKPANEDAQKRKFGETQYDRVKSAFEDALKSWKGSEDELNKHAFGFYEKFRPSVAQGQKGWGRKGELNLLNIKDVVQKTD